MEQAKETCTIAKDGYVWVLSIEKDSGIVGASEIDPVYGNLRDDRIMHYILRKVDILHIREDEKTRQ